MPNSVFLTYRFDDLVAGRINFFKYDYSEISCSFSKKIVCEFSENHKQKMKEKIWEVEE